MKRQLVKQRNNKKYHHKPIPEPPDKSLASGLVFLAASFFNNTRSFDIEHMTRDSRFCLRYRGLGSDEYSSKKRRKIR